MNLSEPQMDVLWTLCYEPWLTPEQLVRWQMRAMSRVQADLNRLLKGKFVQRVNPRCAWIPPRAVYALTDRGIEFLSERDGVEVAAFRRRWNVGRARYTQLLWRLERVWNVRNLILSLDTSSQTIKTLETEVSVPVALQNRQSTVHLHGYGLLEDQNEGCRQFAVEWDSLQEPLERRRWLQLLHWWHTFATDGNALPIMIVAADHWRLVEIWEIYKSALRERTVKPPPIFFTTRTLLRTRKVAEPIWYSSHSQKWGRVFEECAWNRTSSKRLHVISISRGGKIGTFPEKPIEAAEKLNEEDLLQLHLQLSPIAKRALHWILRYPLLSANEIAWLGNETVWRVRKELRTLQEFGLVGGVCFDGEQHFVVGSNGWRYGTAEAGLGRAVRRFTKRRGRMRSVRRMTFHLAHTRASNDFFLKWKALAREQRAYFEWRSEPESAEYFRRGQKLHARLPDGMGIWKGSEKYFVFVAEMDRTRESQSNLRKKFCGYYAWQAWKAEQGLDRTTPEMLWVTTSWTRAARIKLVIEGTRTWRDVSPLSVWFTSFQEIDAYGIASPIWRHISKFDVLQHLPCFGDFGIDAQKNGAFGELASNE